MSGWPLLGASSSSTRRSRGRRIFPRLRAAIDVDRSRKGGVLLLGSVLPRAHGPGLGIAGRSSRSGGVVCRSFSKSWGREPSETVSGSMAATPTGGVLDPEQCPGSETGLLVASLTQRDLPNWGLTAHPATTSRLIPELAAVHGQAGRDRARRKPGSLLSHGQRLLLDRLARAPSWNPPPRALPRRHRKAAREESESVLGATPGLLHDLMNVAVRP